MKEREGINLLVGGDFQQKGVYKFRICKIKDGRKVAKSLIVLNIGEYINRFQRKK